MKILAIHTANHPIQEKQSAVDKWRMGWPLAELKKHVDWQIDERLTVIPHIEEYKNPAEFTEAEMESAFNNLCSYDVIISSYQTNPTIYSLLQVARDRAGTQYILDVDDDMFAINPDNPVWLALQDKHVYYMQRMIANNPWISTTTEILAESIRKRRPDHPPESVIVRPNLISDAYQHPPFDNGDKVVIGFFGGSSHYGDLHRTGVLDALQKLMHEHKNVYFKSIGMPIDTYLPRQRVIIGDAKKGDAWLDEIYPSMNLDIAIAPLEDNLFNRAKSNIKWQEASRAGAAFVCSNVGPYATLKSTALRTKNGIDNWYNALRQLVENKRQRQQLAKVARMEVEMHYRLEDHWTVHKAMFETVYASKKRAVKV